MRLHRRLMKPTDVEAAVALVALEADLRHRYGSLLEQLPAVWLTLLQHNRINAVVIEDLDDPNAGMAGVGVTTFVTDEFLRLCKMAPMPWMGPELVRLMSEGRQPILTSDALRIANSDGGLNLLIWTASVRKISESDQSMVNGAMADAYSRGHAGFQIKEIVAQPVNPARAQLLLKSGMLLWDCSVQQYAVPTRDQLELSTDQPFMVGVTRTLASRNIWTSHQFNWVAPRIGFAVSEQCLLRAAILTGLTDEELSRELRISISTVKKTWRTIFEWVAQRSPDLLPQSSRGIGSSRGKEKRGGLLAYLQEHPEELRPYAKKMLVELEYT